MDKIQLEVVDFEPGKSFKLFSPRLRNTFLWHYHPEYELVYVEADTGIRHVGSHISGYTQSDLVLIGSNLPHLNFDYRLRSEYHQIVVQLREDFLGTAVSTTPEFTPINQLFKKAANGIAFHGETKSIAVQKLKQLPTLTSFGQLLALMEIFQVLANSDKITILNDEDISLQFFLKDKIRMGAVYEYIGGNYNRHPDVNVIAAKVNFTTAAFCRYFKKQTNITFTDFVNQYRIDVAKNLLMQDKNVTEVCYAVGFESLSYFNKLFNKMVGQNPLDFKKSWVRKQQLR
ncbi:AraC family transcriptional regulator [Mucilaginibacter sp. KACC 22773]|uniref:AraC family transcriptional regulator n=1 Tax=Mucilaginibacter sp. KACC 22773 TaxID=3025671 RepID=UPI002366F033|nr:AraC family transcriptional regulator [Mucilaginibacter sp. KACC 22773]WDF78887.1 AraC family transcriptional regulator [Mucilaginibacter sp. KACC 22773]